MCTGSWANILGMPGPPLVLPRLKIGRIFQKVRRTRARWQVFELISPTLATPTVSRGGGAAVGAPGIGGSAVLDHQTPPPPHPSLPFLCRLAVSDVWACREVPEWALERGHSLPVLLALTHM